MSSTAAQPDLILIRRLADGKVEWIPLQSAPQQVTATPEAAYTLIDRANLEAPQTLVPQRLGKDLVVQVQGAEVLVLDGFFTTSDVAFYPTTNIASGAGPFSGAPLTPDSLVPATPAGEQVVSSADNHDGEKAGAPMTGAAKAVRLVAAALRCSGLGWPPVGWDCWHSPVAVAAVAVEIRAVVAVLPVLPLL